jgi:hypothetical protein
MHPAKNIKQYNSANTSHCVKKVFLPPLTNQTMQRKTRNEYNRLYVSIDLQDGLE